MKIGDKVSVIDENLSGTITSVHGEKVVFADEHGFMHQYLSSKLVLQHSGIYDEMDIEQKFEISAPKSRRHAKNHFVLDLHFELLVDQPESYDSFERLFIQKEKLVKTLEFCKKNKIKKLEIIHGIGDGTLQKMVNDVLESQTNLEFHHNAVLQHQSGSVTVFF